MSTTREDVVSAAKKMLRMLQGIMINSHQHIGLQKLSALTRTLRCSVGPFKNYKFIQDEASGDSVLVCSCFRIIENLEPTCAVGQLVNETVRAHHKEYRTGSGCLVFLAGAWSCAALDCLQRGISVKHIITAMSEGIDICLDVCKKSSVSVKDLNEMEKCTSVPGGLGFQLSEKSTTESSRKMADVHEKCPNWSRHRKVKLSRYFCEDKPEMSTALRPDQHELPDLASIGESLSHGCENSMKLAVEVAQILLKTNLQHIGDSLFDISKVVTCVFPGLPEDCTCVVEGCVVLLSDEQAAVAHVVKQQPLKVALITGDLSHNYCHLGFKSLPNQQRVHEDLDLSASTPEEEWLDKCVKLLLSLEVNLILTNGLASPKVIQHCCRLQILIVEKVNSSILRTIGSLTGAVPVCYATQLNDHCVGNSINVDIWRDLSSYERKSATAVSISTGRNTGLVTAVITSCIYGKLQALEDQFWACLYRLHQALKDRALLPGAGGTELLCAHQLQNQAEHHMVVDGETGSAASFYRGLVFQLMADGLIDYITAVMVNTGRFSAVNARLVISKQLQEFHRETIISGKFLQLILESERVDSVFSAVKPDQAPAVKVYDNLSVKQEAWRKALDLVFLVLQTDAEIITGTGQKTEENLMNL